jgi:hypothetical protein
MKGVVRLKKIQPLLTTAVIAINQSISEASVRERTIPIERMPLVGEVNATYYG